MAKTCFKPDEKHLTQLSFYFSQFASLLLSQNINYEKSPEAGENL